MVVGLVLVVLVLLIVGIGAAVRSGRGSTPRPPQAGVAASTRRVVTLVLLAVLVVVAAIGLAGLLERAMSEPDPSADTAGWLARSLAFALIAGPAALLLWWSVWRRLADPDERASDAWSVYVTAMATAALVIAATATAGTLSALAGGGWEAASAAVAIVWAVIWAWHAVMAHHRDRSPTRWPRTGDVTGSVIGLVIGAAGVAATLGVAVSLGLDLLAGRPIPGPGGHGPWWRQLLEPAAWALVGVMVWWLHWFAWRARQAHTLPARLYLLVLGHGAAAITALTGLGLILYVALRFAFDRSGSLRDLADPLPAGVAAALVGGSVWAYHRRFLVAAGAGTREAARLVLSVVGLGATATGLGIVVNSVLELAGTRSSGPGGTALFLSGISALLVGAPVWWLAWRPTRDPLGEPSAGPVRRVYVVIVVGLTGLIGLISGIVVVNQLFEYLLDRAATGDLVDRIRAPLGLLVATAVVAAYHAWIWQRARAAAPPPPRPSARSIVVVSGSGGPDATAVHDLTGAAVTVWRRSDGVVSGVGASEVAAAVAASAAATGAARVLVLCGPEHAVQAIPLADRP